MAKVQWFVGNLQIEGEAALTSITNGRTRAIYDLDGGSQMIMTGENLKRDADDPRQLGAGTVEKIVIKDENGDVQMTFTGGNYKAAAIGNAETPYMLYYDVLLRGNDTIEGSADEQTMSGGRGDDVIHGRGGSDYIGAGGGSDVMSGGKGADGFFFYSGEKGDDVILDFDIKGADADSLSIAEDNAIERIRPTHKNHDTLLELENGSTILLKNVTKADFVDFWETN